MSETTAAPEEGLDVAVELPADSTPAPAADQTEDQAEEHFTKNASKRISKLLVDRAAERQKRYAAETRAATLEARLARLEQAAATSNTELHASRLEAAKRELREAKNAGDTDAEMTAQVKLAEAVADSRAPRVQHAPEPERPAGPQYTPVMREWMDRNEWFETDPVMKQAALALHQDAVRRGMKPESTAYFAHIDRIKGMFPDRFENDDDAADGSDDEPAQPAATARQVTTSAAPRRNVPGGAPLGNGNRQIRLTADQVEMAKLFKITPAEYAAELQLIEKKGAAR